MDETQRGVIWFCHWRNRDEWFHLTKKEQLDFIEVENKVLQSGEAVGGRRFGPYDTRWSAPWFGFEFWIFKDLEGVEKLVHDFAEVGGYKYSEQSNVVARQFIGPLGARSGEVGRAPYCAVMGLRPRNSFYHQLTFAQQEEEEIASARKLVDTGGEGVSLICGGRAEFSHQEERFFFLEYPDVGRIQEHVAALEDQNFYAYWTPSLMSAGKLMLG